MKNEKRDHTNTVSKDYSTVIANKIVSQLENNGSLNQIVKESMSLAINAGARAIKVKCNGNLGNKVKRSNITFCKGRVNLQNNNPRTIYGFASSDELPISVKVWIVPNTTIQVTRNKVPRCRANILKQSGVCFHVDKLPKMAKPRPQPTPPPTIPLIKVKGYKPTTDDNDIP